MYGDRFQSGRSVDPKIPSPPSNLQFSPVGIDETGLEICSIRRGVDPKPRVTETGETMTFS